jgi:hypothetical protein
MTVFYCFRRENSSSIFILKFKENVSSTGEGCKLEMYANLTT